jgi:hypothetical protein
MQNESTRSKAGRWPDGVVPTAPTSRIRDATPARLPDDDLIRD